MPPDFFQYLYFGSILLLFYSIAGYPLLIGLIAAVTPARRKTAPPSGWELPSVTMIIPAYNEERVILGKLANCKEIQYPEGKLEFLVVSDASSDRTDDLVRVAAQSFDNLRFLRVEGRVGKTECQNIAVRHSKGEVIVFSDADSMYFPDAVMKLAENYVDPRIGGASGRYRYVDPDSSVGESTFVFWEFENLIKRFQAKIRTLTGASGCIYSIRKELYEELPSHISSDIIEPITVVRKGYVIVFEENAKALEKPTSRPKQEFGMRVRVVTGGIIGLLYVRDMLNPLRHPWETFQLFSHKVMRWMVPVFLIVLFLSNLLLVPRSWWYAATFGGQMAFLLAAFIGWGLDRMGRPIKWFSLPLFFVLGNAAILTAIYRVLTGYRATTWETDRRGITG